MGARLRAGAVQRMRRRLSKNRVEGSIGRGSAPDASDSRNVKYVLLRGKLIDRESLKRTE